MEPTQQGAGRNGEQRSKHEIGGEAGRQRGPSGNCVCEVMGTEMRVTVGNEGEVGIWGRSQGASGK